VSFGPNARSFFVKKNLILSSNRGLFFELEKVLARKTPKIDISGSY
jgi:hypothetical protein